MEDIVPCDLICMKIRYCNSPEIRYENQSRQIDDKQKVTPISEVVSRHTQEHTSCRISPTIGEICPKTPLRTDQLYAWGSKYTRNRKEVFAMFSSVCFQVHLHLKYIILIYLEVGTYVYICSGALVNMNFWRTLPYQAESTHSLRESSPGAPVS